VSAGDASTTSFIVAGALFGGSVALYLGGRF
jgi:hypothetical protein